MTADTWVYVIQGVGTAVITIVGNYFWLSFQIKQHKKDINGIGQKLNKVIDKQSDAGERLARIETAVDYLRK